MTNEEYILAKKRAKFNLIWDNLINKLPKSSQHPLEKNDCAFNSKLYNHKEQYIICRRVSVKNFAQIHHMNKSELEQIFLDYESYLAESKEYRIRAQERIDNGLEISQSDINRLEMNLAKEVRRLKNEQRYAETLIKIGGGSLEIENGVDKLSLHLIGKYIKDNRAKRKFGYIYFEFKEYGIEKISQIIWRKYKVEDVLIEQKISKFVDFCKQYKIADIYDLLLIPYYCKKLVCEFGADCLQSVINSIKIFIELQIFEYTNISFDDLE